MARIDTLGNFLTDVATAIRNKKGTTDTIVASNFDTEIESIESGGGELPTVNNINDVSGFIYDMLVPEYNKTYDTDEPTTIYSPAENYNRYYVFKRNTGTYRIVWTNCNTAVMQIDKTSVYMIIKNINIGGSVAIFVDNEKKDKSQITNLKISGSGYGGANTYYLDCDTVDECIEKLKNPNTQYNLSEYYNYGFNYNNNGTNTACVLTNGIEIGYTGLINECGRQISSNETIEVIQ